jgi:cysteine desulfurase
MIYLDHNSTTKLSSEALEKMRAVYALPLNSSAIHSLGRVGSKFVEEARNEIKKLLNAENYEVIFTSGATESNNTILHGCDADKILFSGLEHSSVFECRPQNKKIIEIEALKNGLIDLEDLEKKLPQDGNFLISLMLANNEVGAIQPAETAAKLAHQKHGLFHCDITQAVGKIEVDLEKINVDFASLSAHKFGGPQGVGAILIRKGIDLKPLFFGGKQEKSKRAGTLNVAGIAGFGVACNLAKKNLSTFQNLKNLRDFLETEITKIAGNDVKIFASEVSRLVNTSCFSIRNCDAQTGLINFDLNEICASSGSACSSGTVTESRVLKAMKAEKEFLSGAIRVSLGIENTKAEIEKFISVLREFYKRSTPPL